MKHQFLALAIAALTLTSAHAAPVSYTLPDETAAFKPGPNLEVLPSMVTSMVPSRIMTISTCS